MTIGRQGRKGKIGGGNEAVVGFGPRPLAKGEDVTDAAPADFGALRSETRSAYQVLKVATEEYTLAWDVALIELEDRYELETGCGFSAVVSMVLANYPCNTRIATG